MYSNSPFMWENLNWQNPRPHCAERNRFLAISFDPILFAFIVQTIISTEKRKGRSSFCTKISAAVGGGEHPLGSPVYFIPITSPLYPYHMRLSHYSSCTQFSRASLGSSCLIFFSLPTAFNLPQTTLDQYGFKLFYICNLGLQHVSTCQILKLHWNASRFSAIGVDCYNRTAPFLKYTSWRPDSNTLAKQQKLEFESDKLERGQIWSFSKPKFPEQKNCKVRARV